ncbi:MAG: NnrU family protein [Sphingomonadales bacterium]
MEMLVSACVFFLGLHFVVSGTPVRDIIVRTTGEAAFAAGFAILAGAGLVWMIVAYGSAPRVELWHLPTTLTPLFLALNLIACIFIVAGLTVRNPTAIGRIKALNDPDVASGFLRITRHPMNCGIALFCLVHVLENGQTASLVLFGSILALAALGPRSIDAKRKQAHGEAWDKFAAVTSHLPFAAIVEGRNSFKIGELGWWRIALGVVLFAALFYLHEHVSGVALGLPFVS